MMSIFVDKTYQDSISAPTTVTYVPVAGNWAFQGFEVGCDTVDASNSKAELYWDQTGDESALQLIAAIYTSGETNNVVLDPGVFYNADGTARFVVKRSFFNGGGARQIYARVQGFTA
jgi:hypothetical protein